MSTPEEVFSGKKPDISHLRIFCSPVYIHVTKDAKKKLEPTAKVGSLWDRQKHQIGRASCRERVSSPV